MNINRMVGLLVGLAVCLIMGLAGCSDENSKFKGEFLSGCMQGGASKALCGCMYDKLISKYTPEQMLLATYKLQQNEVLRKQMAEDTIDFAIMCRK